MTGIFYSWKTYARFSVVLLAFYVSGSVENMFLLVALIVVGVIAIFPFVELYDDDLNMKKKLSLSRELDDVMEKGKIKGKFE